ncbi:MAG TPA: YceI family protein [bacterium]|nr:YceI family protein [bacterium]
MRFAPVVVLSATLALSGSAFAETSSWTVDPEHSSAQFAVKHLGLSNVRGEMGKVTGTLVYDDKDVSKSTVEATIDVKAINTREEKRDAHLRSDAFFDVEHHPNITFKSTKVAKAGKGKLKVTGDLTIREKTKPVVLDVDFPGTPVTAYGDTHLSAEATTKINRQDFGVSWNTTVDTGGLLVGDEVSITIEMDFVKVKAAKDAAPAASVAPAASATATAAPAPAKRK